MGKRSDFERVARDYYPTPEEAVKPLIDHLPQEGFSFVEPCAGDGRLVDHIELLTDYAGNCHFASDIEPQRKDVMQWDALDVQPNDVLDIDYCITNPPWERNFLHNFIDTWLGIMPTWLLFDADWMHTKQSSVLITYCSKIVSVGRVKWIEGSKHTGKDNCAWYLFDQHHRGPTQFYGRLIE